MNEGLEQPKEITTLGKIKECVEAVEKNISLEVQRTGQSWFPCFRTTVWKVIPTLLSTAKLKKEISSEQEESAQKEISNILDKAGEYEIESGTPSVFEEGVPSDEVKQELIGRLQKVLGILE
jgi:hypothetical protein